MDKSAKVPLKTNWPPPGTELSAYLFTFPYWLYIDRKNPPKVKLVSRNNVGLRIYPPFRSGVANFIPMPPVAPKAVPFLKKARPLPPDAPKYFSTYVGVPLLATSSSDTGNVFNTISPHWPKSLPRSFPMDSVRIDLLAPDTSGKLVQDFLEDLIEHLRYRSRQWWIGRSLDPLLGNLRHIAPIVYNGTFIKPPEAHGRFRTAYGDESMIDDTMWDLVMEDLANNVSVPVYDILLQDGRYFAGSHDMRRSILDSATACEQVKDLTAERIWQRVNPEKKYRRGKVLRGYDLSDHINRDIKRITGRSYKDEHTSEAQDIEILWRLRNSVAHGSSPKLDGLPIDDKIAMRLNFAAGHCVRWLLHL